MHSLSLTAALLGSVTMALGALGTSVRDALLDVSEASSAEGEFGAAVGDHAASTDGETGDAPPVLCADGAPCGAPDEPSGTGLSIADAPGTDISAELIVCDEHGCSWTGGGGASIRLSTDPTYGPQVDNVVDGADLVSNLWPENPSIAFTTTGEFSWSIPGSPCVGLCIGTFDTLGTSLGEDPRPTIGFIGGYGLGVEHAMTRYWWAASIQADGSFEVVRQGHVEREVFGQLAAQVQELRRQAVVMANSPQVRVRGYQDVLLAQIEYLDDVLRLLPRSNPLGSYLLDPLDLYPVDSSGNYDEDPRLLR